MNHRIGSVNFLSFLESTEINSLNNYHEREECNIKHQEHEWLFVLLELIQSIVDIKLLVMVVIDIFLLKNNGWSALGIKFTECCFLRFFINVKWKIVCYIIGTFWQNDFLNILFSSNIIEALTKG